MLAYLAAFNPSALLKEVGRLLNYGLAFFQSETGFLSTLWCYRRLGLVIAVSIWNNPVCACSALSSPEPWIGSKTCFLLVASLLGKSCWFIA